MGLDMFVYSIDKNGKEKEISYFRKHNRLHGWMERLWNTKKEEYKNKPLEDKFIDALDSVKDDSDVFNGVPLELDEIDIDSLEIDIENKNLPETQGFFFGEDSYQDYEEYYKKDDLNLIKKARKELKKGNKILYTSSW
jgi:hypothetical protein